MIRNLHINQIAIFLLVLFITCCQQSSINSNLFEKGKSLGVNKNDKLEEASGLIASIRQPGYLWTHNDSGHPSKIFLINEKAKTEKVFTLAVENRDWEDISIGAGPEENIPYLYVGDIGDNVGRFPYKYIHRIKEPLATDPEDITDVKTFVVKLDDGARDMETLLCDPVSKNLYLVSKREKKVNVYEIAFPFEADTLIARNVGSLPLKSINGGSISTDGTEVLLRNYEHIYYWKKKGNESIPELLQTEATELPYDREPQGESIAWSRDASGFFTLGENAKGERSKLYFYRRK